MFFLPLDFQIGYNLYGCFFLLIMLLSGTHLNCRRLVTVGPFLFPSLGFLGSLKNRKLNTAALSQISLSHSVPKFLGKVTDGVPLCWYFSQIEVFVCASLSPSPRGPNSGDIFG